MSAEPTPARFLRTMLFLNLGPVAWALHLTVVYALQPAACDIGGERVALSHALVLGVTALLLAGLVAAFVRAEPLMRRMCGPLPEEIGGLLATCSRMLTLLSGIAIAWAGVAPLFVDACAPMR